MSLPARRPAGAGWQVPVFGVRHLSPMGAWQLRDHLERTRPELVLVEGLDDATPLLADLVRPETKPPVAILAYTDTLPVRTLLYPFAEYSPELQALRWAHERGVPVEFFDLPSDVFLGLLDAELAHRDAARQRAEPAPPPSAPETAPSIYERIAATAGERDYDTFWERSFEHGPSLGGYAPATLELGRALRELEDDHPRWRAENLVREAYMRRRVEAALAAGHDPARIVLVVGAFHAPVLSGEFPAMSDDELARLPRRPSRLTLMPYSYLRLSSQSGYGAGNRAPAYFQLLWEALTAGGVGELSRRYLSEVARQVRAGGTHRSTAEVIDAVRLAETLSALVGGHAPTLSDLHDAAIALLGHGQVKPIAEALAQVDVGTAIGELPAGVSRTSIQADFERELRRLRLERHKTTTVQALDLDLREDRRASTEASAFLDLHRSAFLHRLRVLGVSFAKLTPRGEGEATHAERWALQWSPESEIELVEAVLLGETVELATAYQLKTRLDAATSIDEAARLVRDTFECGLLESLELARRRLQELAATSHSLVPLADATWALGQVVRYGDVRRFDARSLAPLMAELFVEAALALPTAASGDDRAAKEVRRAMDALDRVALEHSDSVEEPLWLEALARLADADDKNPQLSGYAAAILLERGRMDNAALAREVGRRLSPGAPADLGAGWFAGLAGRNRYALLARQTLWAELAGYVASLDEGEFRRAVVFLRRAFGPFSGKEKRQITENLAHVWGVDDDDASRAVEAPLTAAEEETLADLAELDFDDL